MDVIPNSSQKIEVCWESEALETWTRLEAKHWQENVLGRNARIQRNDVQASEQLSNLTTQKSLDKVLIINKPNSYDEDTVRS